MNNKKFLIGVFFIILCFISYNLYISEEKKMSSFSKIDISADLKQDMIKKNIWSISCPVPINRLKLLRVSYIDFDGNEHEDGEIIVFDVLADHVLSLFHELYIRKFPIASISLINNYNGDDLESMKANNTSAFNCRVIKNTSKLSIHSYGMAIDINPQQNPYLLTEYESGKVTIPVYPPLGMEYINRANIRAGMVETVIDVKNHFTVIDLFNQHGFSIWGGKWNFPIDWQHFQLTRTQAEELSNLSYEEGVEYFSKLTYKSASTNISKDK